MRLQNNHRIADIHTHILPCVDDGPSSVEESLEILKQEKAQGITDVVFTPHFRFEKENVDEFIYRRDNAFNKLMREVEKDPVLSTLSFYTGAEVWYDPNIIYQDISKLCIQNTSYILIELLSTYPFNIENTISWLTSNGVTPILAHIERYLYLTENLKLMQSFAEMGAIFQCNASSLFSKHNKRVVKSLIKHDLVHLFSSDTHNLAYRPPNLADAYNKLKGKSQRFIMNSVSVLSDDSILQV